MKTNPRKEVEIYHPSINSRSSARRNAENRKIERVEDNSTEAELDRLLKEVDAA